jgi:hypothetical protein
VPGNRICNNLHTTWVRLDSPGTLESTAADSETPQSAPSVIVEINLIAAQLRFVSHH